MDSLELSSCGSTNYQSGFNNCPQNVAVYVTLDVDLRQSGRHCFKCIFFAFGDEAERVSGLYANVHTDVLTSDTSRVLVLSAWPLPMFSLGLCRAYHLL